MDFPSWDMLITGDPWSLIVVVSLTIIVEFVANLQQTWVLENTLEIAKKKVGENAW